MKAEIYETISTFFSFKVEFRLEIWVTSGKFMRSRILFVIRMKTGLFLLIKSIHFILFIKELILFIFKTI